MDKKALELMLQDKAEIDRLADIFKAEGVASFLEIGSNHGGSLWALGKVLPTGGRVVSVDIETEGSLLEIANELRVSLGLEVHVLRGDSADRAIVKKVEALAPFDAVFIDGDHTLSYVIKDWENYGRLARKIVAFHDIAWSRGPSYSGTGIEVPKLWPQLKADHRHEEIKLCPTGRNNGIGVLWVT